MQVFYGPTEEHLTYVVRSAIWHYLRHLDECANRDCSSELLAEYIQKASAAQKMLQKAYHPAKSSSFRLVCDTREEQQLMFSILEKYLQETDRVCAYFPFSSLLEHCSSEKGFITCRILPSVSL